MTEPKLPATPTRVLEPLRLYSADELKRTIGETLFDQLTSVALCHGRYWGQTVIDALNRMGAERVDYWHELRRAKLSGDRRKRTNVPERSRHNAANHTTKGD